MSTEDTSTGLRQRRAVEDAGQRVMDGMTPAQIAEAYRAAQTEHKMAFKQAMRVYWKGMLWSAVMSLAIIMESYDTMLVGSFYALPSFQKQFGIHLGGHKYQLTAPIQTAFSITGLIGLIIGVHINGALMGRSGRFGHRQTVMICLAFVTAFVFMLFFAKNVATLIVGEMLINIPIGFINNVAPAYAIEVAPLPLRHYGPSYIQLTWVFGHLFGSGILKVFAVNPTEWAWRIPYAIQWVWPLPLMILLAFAPDSPWWLARQGRDEEALRALNRLSNGEIDNHETLAFIKHTIQLESALDFGARYRDLFVGIDKRRTEIACLIWASQLFCGFALPSGVYFFSVAGLDASDAFSLQIGQYGTVGVGTIMGMALCQKYGRRTMWFVSMWGMLFALLGVAILASLKTQTPNIVWPQGGLVLVRYWFYGLGVGILPFVYSTEIGSIALRPKTLALSRNVYNVSNILSAVVGTWGLNPTGWNIAGKAAWFSVGFCVLILIWSFWRLPESKDRSYEELDIMFAKGVPARKFKSYVVTTEEQFGVTEEEMLAKPGNALEERVEKREVAHMS